MYVFAPNQTVEIFPYSVQALKRDNANTSFPLSPSDAVLAKWSVFPVKPQEPPDFDAATENLIQVNPTFVNNQWLQSWHVAKASPEEIAERTQNKATAIREDRNARLAACDWTQLADSPLDPDGKGAWALYRETLRMVPQQEGFPWDVQWPPVPGTN
jgi:hypothetical protein